MLNEFNLGNKVKRYLNNCYICNKDANTLIMDLAEKLLLREGLNKTPCRLDILRVLKNSDTALSDIEIKALLAFDYDRATIFRTLRTFLDTGLIHSIPVDSGDVRYAITMKELGSKKNFHAHFHCINCQKVVCLQDIRFNEPKLPGQFKPTFFSLVIDGYCGQCQEQNNPQ